jgi:nitroimidazol reductase NimA-like FMN-containing flavoprotein (pyridoxamine 5'-phosphate oxidase superfamily)
MVTKMSSAPSIRRTDRLMSEEHAHHLLRHGFCGRLATVSADGSPYCVPLLYVVKDRSLYVHSTVARGHLRANVEHDVRVCFEVDEPGRIFDYGRFECDSSVSYRSVIAFGTMQIVTDLDEKQEFLEALMEKYGTPGRDRARGFFPRIGLITVYKMTIERFTGKEQALPEVSQQWPAIDRTPTPDAQPPSRV